MKNKNWRFIYMLIRNAYKFPYALGKMKKGTQKYSENPCKEQEDANYDFIKKIAQNIVTIWLYDDCGLISW